MLRDGLGCYDKDINTSGQFIKLTAGIDEILELVLMRFLFTILNMVNKNLTVICS